MGSKGQRWIDEGKESEGLKPRMGRQISSEERNQGSQGRVRIFTLGCLKKVGVGYRGWGAEFCSPSLHKEAGKRVGIKM